MDMFKEISFFSFIKHLEELRSRLIKSILAWLAATGIFYQFFIDRFLAFVIKPVHHIVFTSPSEAFTARLNLTFLGGFLFALPVILYQLWQFVAAGLTIEERKHVVLFGPLSAVFFILGEVFAYFCMLPFSLRFLLSFSSDLIVPMITVDKYISFVTNEMLSCGVVFELPLILAFLTKIGIATPEFMRQKRRYVIVAIFIVSAIITPPDVASQLLLAVPLVVLYEVGILFSQLVFSRQKQAPLINSSV